MAGFAVTPHVGVWIETINRLLKLHLMIVTPHVGVWIETIYGACKHYICQSLPMWECGLKQDFGLCIGS